MFRKLCSSLIFFIFILFLCPSAFSQSRDCEKVKEECLNEADKVYSDLMLFCSDEALRFACGFYTGRGREACLERIEIDKKFCKDDMREYYQKLREDCYSSYKNCRKGDIFGTITVEVEYNERRIGETPYRVGRGYYTITGFWRYQPKESTKNIKNYRPDNLQMMAKFEEKTIAETEDCPELIAYYQGGGARVLSVDKNFDMAGHPMGRFVKVEQGKPLNYKYSLPKSYPDLSEEDIKEAEKIMKKAMASTGLYSVGHIGEIIKIEGKERLDSDPPKCFEYKPKSINVRFGKFFISDSLKGGSSMSGSKSWPIHGIVGSLVPDDRTIEFTIDYGEIGDPMKCEDRCAGKINVRWRFYEIK